jgi:hypothetical protein
MADPYLTLLTGLSSAAIGGALALLSVFLTNRSNTTRLKVQLDHEFQQRKSELLRNRGEELYELSDKWLQMLAGYYLRRCFVMQGKFTYNDCLDLDIKDGKEKSGNFGRIAMLIDVYFPSTRPAYDKIIESRTELNKIEGSYKRAYENGDVDGASFLTPYVKCQHSIEQAGENFKILVLEAIRSL